MTGLVRFAPSPTGLLHLGNIKAAVINWLYARKTGAAFLLRIDDTDADRSTKAFEDAILRDLTWLGLDWDRFARQSDRNDRYEAAIEKLKSDGHLYACYETPEELERKRGLQRAAGRPPVYDRAGLNLSDEQRTAYEAEGRKPHWRFRLRAERVVWDDLIRGHQEIDAASLSDPVLIRADGRPLYTLTSVVDDGELGVSHIIRGEDHVANTAAQVHLFQALGHPVPVFGHFPLIVDADGAPLSKRAGSLTVEHFRDREIEPQAIVSLLARLGTSQPVELFESNRDAASAFDLSSFGRAAARFDERELEKLSAQRLHGLSASEAVARLGDDRPETRAIWDAVSQNIEKFSDFPAWIDIVERPVAPVIEDAAFGNAAADLLPDDPLTEESWPAWTGAIKDATGRKGRQLFMPLRQALTGLDHGPEMKKLLPLIGAARARARLRGEIA
ncbi:glutamate--tRNA ligase [Minwuia sp.]|uniref:glutamate--tRNA ligase n=1 Tax=Minwuia sp. TaxID=2493630 RepID=UPI003A9570AF